MSGRERKPLRFDIYGQFEVEVVRVNRQWRVLRIGSEGTRLAAGVRPSVDAPEDELAGLLDAHVHELARPGTKVR